MGLPLAGAAPGYLLVRELQFAGLGVAFPLLSMLLGVCAPLILGMWATVKVAGWILRRRTDAWLDELSERYDVPRKELVKYTTPWR